MTKMKRKEKLKNNVNFFSRNLILLARRSIVKLYNDNRNNNNNNRTENKNYLRILET